MLFEHTLPLAQVVHPVHPVPPHWTYLATEQPPGAGAAVVVVALEVVGVVVPAFVVEVDSVVGLAVVVMVVPAFDVVGAEPPPEVPQEKTAGPGTV